MTQFYQITVNDIISGVCKEIHTEFQNEISIYKEEQDKLIDLPAACVYCADYTVVTGRSDRFVNYFDIIINYYPINSGIINNNRRQTMFSAATRISDCTHYVNLPAYREVDGNLESYELPTRRQKCVITEKDGFIQLDTRYVVRTKYLSDTAQTKMNEIAININNSC